MIDPARRRIRLRALALVGCGLIPFTILSARADDAPSRLQRIQSKGFITCGLARAQPGFSRFKAKGEAEGFDADFCRAFAAAIFNDAKKARFTPVATAREFTDRDEIDVAFHRLTVNYTRAVASGLSFTAVTFHDGQGFLVRDGFNGTTIAALPKATVCVAKGTKAAANLARFLAESGLEHDLKPIDGAGGAARAFFQGRCTALSDDATSLFAFAANGMADAYRILDDRISREPLAPAVRRGDILLRTVLVWVIHAMIHAEDVGVTSRNVMNPAVRADRRRGGFLSLPAAAALGLQSDWARAVIREVGNYGEVYARHFSAPGAMRLPRGRNRLIRDGGLLHAPPLE